MIKITLYRLFTMLSHFGNNLYLLNGYWHLVSSLSLLSHTRCLYKHDEKSHKLRVSGERDQEPFYIMSSDLPSRVTNEHFLKFHMVFMVYENFNIGTWFWSLYLVHNLLGSDFGHDSLYFSIYYIYLFFPHTLDIIWKCKYIRFMTHELLQEWGLTLSGHEGHNNSNTSWFLVIIHFFTNDLTGT